ncbi:hypothetical protein MN608_07095 [Microdochium nivale]|nr:hypothetical protein MN608_07095 [Microdochium nivale]
MSPTTTITTAAAAANGNSNGNPSAVPMTSLAAAALCAIPMFVILLAASPRARSSSHAVALFLLRCFAHAVGYITIAIVIVPILCLSWLDAHWDAVSPWNWFSSSPSGDSTNGIPINSNANGASADGRDCGDGTRLEQRRNNNSNTTTTPTRRRAGSEGSAISHLDLLDYGVGTEIPDSDSDGGNSGSGSSSDSVDNENDAGPVSTSASSLCGGEHWHNNNNDSGSSGSSGGEADNEFLLNAGHPLATFFPVPGVVASQDDSVDTHE